MFRAILRPASVIHNLSARQDAPRALTLECVLHVRRGYTVLSAVRHALAAVKADVNLIQEHVPRVILDIMDLGVISSVKDAQVLVVTGTEHATIALVQMCMA